MAVEADWPDAYRADRWARGAGDDPDAAAALGDFTRFPRWMWRNHEVVRVPRWLRAHNPPPDDAPASTASTSTRCTPRSTRSSRYLERVDPDAAARARERYGCFDHFGRGHRASTAGGRASAPGRRASAEVVEQLVELQRGAAARAAARPRRRTTHFYAEQNARLVRNAEAYYRAMFRVRTRGWNLRDRTWPRRWTRCAATSRDGAARRQGRRLGAQLARRRRARHRAWPSCGEINARPARARGLRRATLCSSAEHVRRHGHGRHRLGRPATAMRVAPARADARGAAARHRARRLPAGHGRGRAGDRGAARAAAAARDRRHLPAARPSACSHYVFADVTRQFDALIHLDTTSALAPTSRPHGLQQGGRGDHRPRIGGTRRQRRRGRRGGPREVLLDVRGAVRAVGARPVRYPHSARHDAPPARS